MGVCERRTWADRAKAARGIEIEFCPVLNVVGSLKSITERTVKNDPVSVWVQELEVGAELWGDEPDRIGLLTDDDGQLTVTLFLPPKMFAELWAAAGAADEGRRTLVVRFKEKLFAPSVRYLSVFEAALNEHTATIQVDLDAETDKPSVRHRVDPILTELRALRREFGWLLAAVGAIAAILIGYAWRR
jgi:hypothetical protein